MENSGGGIFLVVWLAVVVAMVAAMWKVFVKAGQPGWAVLIPIYNLYILLKIVGKPAWWIILFIVPLANLIVAILTTAALAKKFGKSTGFAVGLILVPFVFYPILGFGDAQYSAQA